MRGTDRDRGNAHNDIYLFQRKRVRGTVWTQCVGETERSPRPLRGRRLPELRPSSPFTDPSARTSPSRVLPAHAAPRGALRPSPPATGAPGARTCACGWRAGRSKFRSTARSGWSPGARIGDGERHLCERGGGRGQGRSHAVRWGGAAGGPRPPGEAPGRPGGGPGSPWGGCRRMGPGPGRSRACVQDLRINAGGCGSSARGGAQRGSFSPGGAHSEVLPPGGPRSTPEERLLSFLPELKLQPRLELVKTCLDQRDVLWSFDRMPPQRSLKPFQASPCLNGGQCLPLWDHFTCTCPSHTAGRRCEEVRWCEAAPCPAGAVCHPLHQGFECLSNVTLLNDSSVLSYRGRGLLSRDVASAEP
ncbi:unnamed protein product [Arctogadus glacialis]